MSPSSHQAYPWPSAAIPAAASPARLPPVSLAGATLVLPPKKERKGQSGATAGEGGSVSSAGEGDGDVFNGEERVGAMIPLVGLGEEELVIPWVLRAGTRVPSPMCLRRLVPGEGEYPGVGLIKLRDQNAWRATYKHDFGKGHAEMVQAAHDFQTLASCAQRTHCVIRSCGLALEKHEMLVGEGRPASVDAHLASDAWQEALS